MKLMNEIESEYDGVIEAILVNNEEGKVMETAGKRRRGGGRVFSGVSGTVPVSGQLP